MCINNEIHKIYKNIDYFLLKILKNECQHAQDEEKKVKRTIKLWQISVQLIEGRKQNVISANHLH